MIAFLQYPHHNLVVLFKAGKQPLNNAVISICARQLYVGWRPGPLEVNELGYCAVTRQTRITPSSLIDASQRPSGDQP
jgi:hypothetical protein